MDFQIVEIRQATDLHRPHGLLPVHRAFVKSFHNQEVYEFDDRWGSWNSPPDDSGQFKNASPKVAAALQERLRSMPAFGNPFAAPINPFINSVPKPNPFMSNGSQ